jgi:hypothetical protein
MMEENNIKWLDAKREGYSRGGFVTCIETTKIHGK